MLLETPPTAAPNAGLGLFLILAIWGALVDSRYTRNGGKRPTKNEKLFFLSCIAAVVVLLFVLGVLGAAPDSIGHVTPMLAILLFALWEMGRWRVRRTNPLSKTPSNPTESVVPRVGHFCSHCGQASQPPPENSARIAGRPSTDKVLEFSVRRGF